MREKPSGLPPPLRYWFRFVDDTFVIQQKSHKQLFLDHINNIDPAIRFTVEGNQENGSIPFLDTLIKPGAGNSLSITVYCKPTYTDQQLQWNSHHNLLLSTVSKVLSTQGQNSLHWSRTLPKGDTAPKGGFGQVQISQVGHT